LSPIVAARIVLLVTSPRLPAGLLTAQAWDTVRAHPVFAEARSELTGVLETLGASVQLLSPPSIDTLIATAAEHGVAVWLAGPTGDQEFARELGLRLARQPGLAELELMYGSWDPPGARLLDVVTVMDRLVSPGGDPWLSQHAAQERTNSQTHASLAQFLLEEAYEAYDAIGAGELGALREELGDVLLQVVLHARLAEDADDEEDRWSVDDVAGDLVDKLIRRNPHVFGDAIVDSIEEITANWEQIKKAEKTRESALDGIALSQPALSLAAKLLSRAQRAGIDVPLPPASGELTETDESLGAGLLAIVAAARRRGLDPEAALRAAALRYGEAVRASERT
jgi:XTP/dITP diphosphohydrolase